MIQTGVVSHLTALAGHELLKRLRRCVGHPQSLYRVRPVEVDPEILQRVAFLLMAEHHEPRGETPREFCANLFPGDEGEVGHE